MRQECFRYALEMVGRHVCMQWRFYVGKSHGRQERRGGEDSKCQNKVWGYMPLTGKSTEWLGREGGNSSEHNFKCGLQR